MMQFVDILSGSENQVNLTLSATGTTVSVGAGSFRHLAQDYVLDDDVDTDLGTDSVDRVVFGYLVRVVATDEITVLWDIMGPGDWSFSFEPGGPYELIHKLAALEVPADASDFTAENVVFQHFRLIEEA